jgi:drug/metabolite transporter (DMT)-like permease
VQPLITSQHRKKWAIALKILSFILYAWNDVLCKKLSTATALNVAEHSIIVYQYLFATCLLLPFYLSQNKTASQLSSSNLPYHLLRGVLCATGILLLNQSFTVMPLSYAVGFNLFSPILSLSIAILWFKEQLSSQKILALSISIIAYILLIHANIKQPQVNISIQNCLKPSIALLCFQINTLITKKLTQKNETNTNMTIYLFVMITCAMIPLEYQNPSPWSFESMITIALMGAVTTLATLALHQAIQLVDVTFLIPFGFIKYAIIAFFGYICFLEIPGTSHIIGITLTVITLYILQKKETITSSPLSPSPTKT